MPNPGFRVIRPVRVKLYREGDGWAAESRSLGEWGWGTSVSDALLDLMAGIADAYALMDGAKLSRHLERQLERIKRYIEPRE